MGAAICTLLNHLQQPLNTRQYLFKANFATFLATFVFPFEDCDPQEILLHLIAGKKFHKMPNKVLPKDRYSHGELSCIIGSTLKIESYALWVAPLHARKISPITFQNPVNLSEFAASPLVSTSAQVIVIA
jgi:hypothetical protein